jgi:hypothetical protein
MLLEELEESRRNSPLSERPGPIDYVPPHQRPPGAVRSFMMKPQALARAEQLLRRELRILEYNFKTRQITGEDLRTQGHEALERYYGDILEEINFEATNEGLPEAHAEALDLQALLTQAKETWDGIVDDLLKL